ncbi:PaaI family thioesterase [Caulobacter sp. CCNWLY153]|uniref:Thioesterase n=1 Tax=Caulobacter radicis TaxID=2172650 RepID=A0A2T9JMB9_9CAUL|nr:PaaI family thioesterase [Caulobacter radicis]PVM84808.1 thioesterase [Caulobacter radicis]
MSAPEPKLADQIAPGASGLEQLQAMIAAGGRAPIGETLEFSLTEAGDGWAAFEGLPGRHAYNPIGTVHGGYAATLLDSACGCAVHSKLSAKQAYTTLDLKVSYHRPLTDKTGLVRAEGRVVTFGRRAAFAEATIKDVRGRIYATATSSLLVFER